MHEPAVFYQSNVDRHLTKIKALQNRIRWLAVSRLVCFILILVAFYLYKTSASSWLVLLGFFILSFIVLLRLSFIHNAKKNLAGQLLYINQNELNVLHEGKNGFPDGKTVVSTAVFSADLDIFGQGSLFHYLNRTTTPDGNDHLAALLNRPLTDRNGIAEHQAAVRQLTSQADARQMITAAGLLQNKKEGSMAEIREWISAKGRMAGKKWLNIVRLLLPVLNIISFVYYLDSNNPIPLGTGVIISWGIIAIFGKYIHAQHIMIGRKQSILNQYSSVLEQFSKIAVGPSALLQHLWKTADAGRREISDLSRLTGLFDQRLNLLVNFFLNSMLLYDVHCMIALENWKRRNSDGFNGWIEAVGRIEMLNSIASFSFNHPGYCFPEIAEGKPILQAFRLAHPLIPPKEAVPNDVTVGENDRLMIITGSNMSGKSTFLRTVGVNLLLAQCGAPVCAKKFVFTPMHILSSIRISDSLQEHTSYFMAELKRLKEIIAVLDTGEYSLVLIDEVLRGTNSNDKTHGSVALIGKLTGYPGLSLFATHDLSLSELEHRYPRIVSNYCFESTIENGELLFDYTLRRGVASNKNATFLMQKMGII